MINFEGGKDLVWLSSEIKTPPFSKEARIEAGFLLRQLQEGAMLSMPASKPMPEIGSSCHELRINDSESNQQWRIIYLIDSDAIVILGIFAKITQKTPKSVISLCQKRLNLYNRVRE
jgi:phage-related protein